MSMFNVRLLPWTLLLIAGGVLLYLKGFDPTGSVLALAGMVGVAVTTIRLRWDGALGRLGARFGSMIGRRRR